MAGVMTGENVPDKKCCMLIQDTGGICIILTSSVFVLQIDIFHIDEPLSDQYTLMDIAYIYTWRRVSTRITTLVVLNLYK